MRFIFRVIQTQDPSIREFISAYRERFGEAPGLLSAQAYDSAMILLEALSEGAMTSEEVRTFLENLDGFPGVSGKISAGGGGDLKRPLHIIQVKNGRFVELK
jgi:ABC-type branched-subunit amino acid transport system substrate-binding protein